MPSLQLPQASQLTLAAQGVGSVPAVDVVNSGARGCVVGVNITAGTGTLPTLQVLVEGKDELSGSYYTILDSGALVASAGFTLLTVYPGATVAANKAVSQPLPSTWRVRAVVGGTTPAVTATVGVSGVL